MHFTLRLACGRAIAWLLLLLLLDPISGQHQLGDPEAFNSGHKQQQQQKISSPSNNKSLTQSTHHQITRSAQHTALLNILVTVLSCVLFLMICSMLLPLVNGLAGCQQLRRRFSSTRRRFESPHQQPSSSAKEPTQQRHQEPPTLPQQQQQQQRQMATAEKPKLGVQCPVPIRIIEAASDDSMDRDSCVLVGDTSDDTERGSGSGADNCLLSSQREAQQQQQQQCVPATSGAGDSALLCGSVFCYRSDPNIPGSRRQQQQQQQQQMLQLLQQDKSPGTGEQEDSLLLL